MDELIELGLVECLLSHYLGTDEFTPSGLHQDYSLPPDRQADWKAARVATTGDRADDDSSCRYVFVPAQYQLSTNSVLTQY